MDAVTKGDVFQSIQEELTAILPELFILASVLPTIQQSGASGPQYRLAGDVFIRCLEVLAEDSRLHVVAVVQQRAQEMILDSSIHIKCVTKQAFVYCIAEVC